MIMIMSLSFVDHLLQLPGTTRALAKDALLFERGDPVKNLFLVSRGEVHLLRRQIDGAAFILQRASHNAILAEASLMSDSYHCSAVAISDCQITAWPKTMVRNLVAQNIAATQAYAAYLATEVRLARLRGEIASLRRVSDRLDAWLAWHDGALPDRGGWHHVAREINISPEALYRELARRRRQTGGN